MDGLQTADAWVYKRLLNLQEVCLHSAELEATLGHDSGGEQSWSFRVQWDISGWSLQYAGKPNEHIIPLHMHMLTFAMHERNSFFFFYNSPQNPDRYEQIIAAVQPNYTAIRGAMLPQNKS